MKASSGSSREPQGRRDGTGRFGRMRRWLARLALRLAQRLTERLERALQPASDTAAKSRFADAPAAWRRVLAETDPSLLDGGQGWRSFGTSDWAAPGDFPRAPSAAARIPEPPLPPHRASQAYRSATPTDRDNGARPMPHPTAAAAAEPQGVPEWPPAEADRPPPGPDRSTASVAGNAVRVSTAAPWPAPPQFRPVPRFLDRPDVPARRPLPSHGMLAVVAGRRPLPPGTFPGDPAMRRDAEPQAMPAASAPPPRARTSEVRPAPTRPNQPAGGALEWAMPGTPRRQAWPAMLDPTGQPAPAAGQQIQRQAAPPAAAPDRPAALGHTIPASGPGEPTAAFRPEPAGTLLHDATRWPTLPARRQRPGGGRPVGRGLRDDFAARGASEAGRGTWTG